MQVASIASAHGSSCNCRCMYACCTRICHMFDEPRPALNFKTLALYTQVNEVPPCLLASRACPPFSLGCIVTQEFASSCNGIQTPSAYVRWSKIMLWIFESISKTSQPFCKASHPSCKMLVILSQNPRNPHNWTLAKPTKTIHCHCESHSSRPIVFAIAIVYLQETPSSMTWSHVCALSPSQSNRMCVHKDLCNINSMSCASSIDPQVGTVKDPHDPNQLEANWGSIFLLT